jgi:hypothetical protein
MKQYLSDIRGNLQELGDTTLESGETFLRAHYAEQGKDVLFIGFNRSEKDFVEIGYIGKEKFSIHTDTIAGSPSFFSRLLAKPIDLTVDGLDPALDVLKTYFDLSRADFEAYLKRQKR